MPAVQIVCPGCRTGSPLYSHFELPVVLTLPSLLSGIFRPRISRFLNHKLLQHSSTRFLGPGPFRRSFIYGSENLLVFLQESFLQTLRSETNLTLVGLQHSSKWKKRSLVMCFLQLDPCRPMSDSGFQIGLFILFIYFFFILVLGVFVSVSVRCSFHSVLTCGVKTI